MSFQLPTTTTAGGTGFTGFGLTSTPAAPQAQGNLAAKPPTFSFGASGGGDAGAAMVAKPPTFGLSAAPAAATTATPAPGLGGAGGGGGGGATIGAGFFSAPVAAAATPITTTATPTALLQPATPATTAPPAAAPQQQQQPAAAAAPLPTLALPKTTTVATLGLGLGGGTGPATTTAAAGFVNLSTATKTTDSAAVANAAQISYNQLEEHINKWTLELEEQEKTFTDQATQINAWDKVLIGNNQKILELNDAVQKVKSDQQTLEQELEFIATQHKELEESILPLQKEFLKLPQVDVERSQTYLMVENLDTQLKQMSEDLKEIIDNLNESNKGQDNSDPIIQIGKILNAHMSSLQWIESSSTNICNKLDDITKMHESFKRDSERSFRSAYYN